VLESPPFRRAERSSALLRFVVERTLDGESDRLKEYTVGVEALGRGAAFDPRTDPIVRAEASRLRDRLARYYETAGTDDPIVVELPKGSYVPRFVARAAAAGDLAIAAPATSIATPARAGPPSWRAWLPVSALLVASGVAAVAMMKAARPADAPLLRLEVELRSDGTLGSEVGTDFALSADGTRLVFVARDADGLAHVYSRHLDRPDATRLPGTDGARVPFLSPDGRWVGFWADGQLKKTPFDGGAPVVLCAATDLLGASWGDDGDIVAALSPTGKLWRVSENGGTPRPVVDRSAEQLFPLWPQRLPDGETIVYTATSAAGADRSTVEAVRRGERTVLVRGGTYGRVLPNGFLVYVNQGTLYAVPFDAERLAVRGAAVPILDDVAYARTFGYAQLDVSRTGTLVYRRSAGSGQVVVASLDRAGESRPLLPKPGRYDWPSISPDGSRLAVADVESGVPGLRVLTLGTGDVKRLAGIEDFAASAWWPDGRLLLLGGRAGMAAVDPERGDPPTRLTRSERIQVPWSVSPDGRRLAYHEMSPSTAFDLWTVPVSRTDGAIRLGTPEPFLRTPAYEVYPTFSPDGQWLAYSSNESGGYEIYVRHFPDDGTKVRVSQGGGRIVHWSPNRRELLFQTDDHRVMVAPYRVERGAFMPGAPRLWTPRPLADAGVYPSFDLTPDGERLVALLPAARPEEQQSPNHVTLLLNVFDEIRRRVQQRGPR
jgi:serine/threonine-protein kinase